MRERAWFPNQDSNVAPQTLQDAWPVCGTKNFVSVRCTQRRNRIGRLSPFSEYAPSANRFKPDCSPQSKVTHSPDWRAQHRSNGKVRPPFGNAYWSPEEANLCRWQRLDVNRFKRSISGADFIGRIVLENSQNAGRLIFRGKTETSDNRRSMQPQTRYRNRL
jgi:hypothetical protein